MSNPTEDEDFSEPEIPYDASDPKRVNDTRKKASRLRQKRLDFVRQMMDSQEGRLWCYGLLESCVIFGNPLQPGQSDVTFFNIGQQNVGKRILVDITEAAPEMYMKMMAEGMTEK